MKSSTILKISCGVILFHLLGHSIGHFTWKDTDDAGLLDIISKMYSHQFEFMGKTQTLGGHHDGYSLLFAVTLTMLTAITWIASGQIDTARQIKAMLMVTGIALLFCGVIEMIYFFPLAGGTSLLAGAMHYFVYLRETISRRAVQNA
ncbi:MAG TPA: hypothetical protein VGD40_02305 [Chryseosolibacter sp.]